MFFCFTLAVGAIAVPTVAQAEICPGRVASVAALGTANPTGDAPTNRYAFTLTSEQATSLGVTIVAVADGRTWATTIPMQPLRQMNSELWSFNGSERLVMRFPAPVRLLGAWVRAAMTPGKPPAQCPVNNVATLAITAAARGPIVLPKPGAPEFTMASEGRTDIPAECTHEEPAATLTQVTPSAPWQAAGQSGRAVVEIDLRADNSIADVRIAKSTGNSYLDAAAVDATRRSTFRTQSFLCRPVASSFLYLVNYVVWPRS